jgi:heterodisulfide reductase subunit A-like polyferredoxin
MIKNSIWKEPDGHESNKQLTGKIKRSVVVIGGGIAGSLQRIV